VLSEVIIAGEEVCGTVEGNPVMLPPLLVPEIPPTSLVRGPMSLVRGPTGPTGDVASDLGHFYSVRASIYYI
jgi:hypothetical protein